jgi:hypothetical protein
MRLCIDCRFSALEETGDKMVWRCIHTAARYTPAPDYVTGKPVEPHQLSCRDMRLLSGSAGGATACEPEGKYWEAR